MAKLRITFKDPDGPWDCINEHVNSTRPEGLSDKEWDTIREGRAEEVQAKLKKWIEFGEYVCVEFDLDAMTGIIVENK